VIARLILWLRGVEAVSPAWLDGYASESTKAGWTDGPVWRTPKEIARMRRNMARIGREVAR